MWLMALGDTTPARVIGWIETGFHERFAWSEARWQFVPGRMRAACAGIVVGDAMVLHQQFGSARLMTIQTYNPDYAQAIAYASILAEPVTRQFEDPPSAMPSFSRIWQRVVPKVGVAGSGKVDRNCIAGYGDS